MKVADGRNGPRVSRKGDRALKRPASKRPALNVIAKKDPAMKLSRLSLVLPVLAIAACDMPPMKSAEPVVTSATTPGGMTHQAIEDVAVMRAIPNMTVLDCGDATEVESVVEAADAIDGPVYCRILRGEVAGAPFNRVGPEDQPIPAAFDRVALDPARIGVFVDDWRIEPLERAA